MDLIKLKTFSLVIDIWSVLFSVSYVLQERDAGSNYGNVLRSEGILKNMEAYGAVPGGYQATGGGSLHKLCGCPTTVLYT